MAQGFPEYAALANPAPVSVAEVQAELRPDEALVLVLDTPEWKPTPEETFLWVVTKTRMRWARTELGTPALTRELIEAGADLHAVNADGNQALWLACVTENVETMGVLIEAGIDVQHVNATGATPLMFAASSGRARAVARLLAAGADPLLDTGLGLTAMDMASTAECLRQMRDAARRG
jgi:ankyrin repeat protein